APAMSGAAARPLWTPSPERAASTRMGELMAKQGVKDYAALHAWSVREPEAFWNLVWDDCGALGTRSGPTLVDGERMPGAQWFPQARLSFAENLLRRRDDGEAIVFWGEDRVRRRLSHRALHELVSRLAQALSASGVRKGDRVAGYLPNLPEATAAMLAATSLGAIWSSCSPDFGVQGVLDRFGQIEPKVLFCADGYYYGGKEFDCQEKVKAILGKLPSVEACVVLPYLGTPVTVGVSLERFLEGYSPGDIAFEQVEFNHPLYILYSSGTTGVPKCIVHGTGGTLLQHLKEHQYHSDVRPGDRLFYFTTLGWMMWNWLVSGLASGATLMLYDGSPSVGRGRILFDYAEAERVTHFGTSAKFIDSLIKLKLEPKRSHRLEALRAVLSTGSPLSPEGFDYVYGSVKDDVCLSSISGGTDIVSCFVLGNPAGPVWRGEIQAKGLGMAVEVWDEEGRPVAGEKGELVCTCPFPSMPVGFWNDADGTKYRGAYFGRFPGVWCHGDFAEITSHGGIVIHGRSDATLNPGGVRIGTAEIYAQVEQLPEVQEALAIGQDWQGDVRVVLFVVMRSGHALDDAMQKRIREKIRSGASPRHVPAKIVAVADIPRTKSGKITELAVRDIVHGREVKNREALANPEALALYRNLAELAS
ncbi:MAG TPA: acetoacetate--CoA ligase, partial [Burkholderiales bacterium]|nr:acetoacetate--CoA ligase [Burkholderiales bacterium]